MVNGGGGNGGNGGGDGGGAQTQESRGGFRFRWIGGNHVVIFPHPKKYANSAITMTGGDVDLFIQIPYFHRIVKLELIHLDSAYAKSIDALDVLMEIEQGRSIFSSKYTNLLFKDTNIVVAEILEKFGEGFEYEPRTWTLTLNTTNTDLVIPILYIQKLGK